MRKFVLMGLLAIAPLAAAPMTAAVADQASSSAFASIKGNPTAVNARAVIFRARLTPEEKTDLANQLSGDPATAGLTGVISELFLAGNAPNGGTRGSDEFALLPLGQSTTTLGSSSCGTVSPTKPNAC